MKKQRLYAPKEFRIFHIRFPADLFSWLKAEAARNHRKVTGEIIMAIEHWRKIQNK